MISKNQQKLIRSLSLKKNRERERLFVAEGPKVVADLQHAGFVAEQLYAIPDVSEEEMQRVSFLQHPQGVIALFRLPDQPPLDSIPFSDLTLMLDGIQDPGNLGTIIRIADWFGIEHIICSLDTADCWAPKVVQASMGSIARVHIYYTDLLPLLDQAVRSNIPVYGTLLDGENIYQHELTDHGIIVMGNEGKGISEPVRQRVTHRLLIPNFHAGPSADSLNVAIATAITCSEFRRRTK